MSAFYIVVCFTKPFRGITPWKESYDQPREHIEKQDITLLSKVRLVKAMVFPVVMYGCES